MQFFKTQEDDPGKSRGESARLPRDGGMGEENSQRQLAGVFLAVLLLHGALIAYLQQSHEPETPAEPLVMEVALLAAPAPPQAKPAPPAPPVAKPTPKPAPAEPKKAPVIPKKAPVARKPVIKPAPPTEPALKPEAAEAPAPISRPVPPVAAPPRPTVSAAVPSPPKTETFTEANYRANYKSNPKPEYPRMAKSRGWQGKVLLRVQVTADGHSAGVQVQQSSGHDLLDEAAVEAVKSWTFIPAKRGETPVASTVTVPIQFKLNE
ncbi:MAG: TonB family protein [Methylomicrobium sp.]